MSILTRELASIYHAFRNNQPNPLPDLPVQYADFSVWQRQWLESRLEDETNTWAERLDGAPGICKLPYAGVRPQTLTDRAQHQTFTLEAPLTASLRKLARDGDTTLFALTLAAFNALLYCATGEEDIVLGTDAANRDHLETENLIGFFINQLVLRTRVNPEEPFNKLLASVHETALEAYAHQEMPFDILVRELAPERDLNTHPFFQIKFVLHNLPESKLEAGDLSLENIPLDVTTNKLDLQLNLYDLGETLFGSLDYKCDLFENVMISRLIRNYKGVLSRIIENSKIPLIQLKQDLDGSERQERKKKIKNKKGANPFSKRK